MENQETIELSQYAIQNVNSTSWEVLLNLNRPIPNSSAQEDEEQTTTYTGISSYLGKLNIFILTRQNFLKYLNFFEGYSKDYQQMYDEYLRISDITNTLLIDYMSQKNNDLRDIEEKYQLFIERNFDEICRSSQKNLKNVYLTFFRHYEYFKNFNKGYTFFFQDTKGGTRYYGNVIGTSYPILPETPSLLSIEFDQAESLENNFRLYPLIPLEVDPERPEITLAVFGNTQWVSPARFIFPYRNDQKPNYKFSLNSISVVKSIHDLNRISIENLEVKMKIESYYFNGKLYPASDPTKDCYLTLYCETSSKKVMRGVPLFNSGAEWIEKPINI